MPRARSLELLNAYLGEVQKHLPGLSPLEVSEIVDELRSHILDSVEKDLSEDSVRGTLVNLGDSRE